MSFTKDGWGDDWEDGEHLCIVRAVPHPTVPHAFLAETLIDGSIVHTSEHHSLKEAVRAAKDAADLGVALRDGPNGFKELQARRSG
jgi:hypothetical protein